MSTAGSGANPGVDEQVVRAVLADGSVVTVRFLERGDLAELEHLHGALSAEDRYLRFFGAPSDASINKFLRGLVEPSGAHVVALGAFEGTRLIGVGHYELVLPEVAEVAFVVEHARHARGVATLLLEHLVAVARQRGVRTFVAEVLAENSAMLQVLRDSGLPHEAHLDGSSYQVRAALDAGEPYQAKVGDRERIADVASLRRVLSPASVAVIGAGRRPASVGNAVLRNIVHGGYGGTVHAVNRSGREVHGVAAVRSVADIPEPPELAVVCVPAESVPTVAEECGRCGVHALVVVTAGITGLPDVANGLLTAVRRWGMRLVGPNCLGLVNSDPQVRLDATFGAAGIPAGAVGVVTQSGGVGIALLERLGAAGLGVSTLVSTGDKYDVSGNDMLLWWERDERTRIGVLYLESFGNPRKFSWLARRIGRSKPLVVLRSGSSPIAQRAALSHTAATATPSSTRDALLRQTGAIGADDWEELVAVLGLLSWQPLPAGPHVAVVSNAGGLGVLAADACARAGLEFADFPQAQRELADLLPGQASARNPVDTTATIDAVTFGRSLEVVLRDPAVHALVVPVLRTAIGDPGDAVAEAVARARAAGCDKPVLVVRPGQQESVRALPAGTSQVPVFADPALAARALADVVGYATWLARPRGAVPDLGGIDVGAARAAVVAALDGSPSGRWLEPEEVQGLLTSFGLSVVPTTLCRTEAEALAAFGELGGSVALKVRAEGVLHKGRAGGVLLGVSTVAELRAGWTRLRERFGAGFGGVVLQPMVEPGREFLVGVLSEPSFGPMIVFGMGGTDTDLIADRSRRLVPLTTRDACEMLDELRAAPGLFGPDADRALDTGAVVDVLLRTARLAELVPEVVEADLNPVIATGSGVRIPDARIRLEPRVLGDPFLRELGG
ncbi:bifunctional GNAT family N-acetyltransferase/acetate--CoA ligase family protein [Saccharopolyspora indica]|uniref:bifunctional acetate--CoA ligase family protein/GNAT family N-acetyltransferase n=1 Tax=Saccharopolyspora indica TaxID=1229659 RepID=UPI0022EA183A|nr:bifunctional GNAT family N-acetyltransferase/acetate--CoA ligase family protein [Saccharopolyspora indica]MDA3644312.1 bifunctional GNAT family N-acetyltransferase/acetate--CoA ligase family protein [Saccharopolyspora indica]